MSTYALSGYAGMLDDPVRVRAYRQALERVLKPGDVVVDLGAGFGYFALVACQLGARRVYAIEPAESIELLPELAKANNFADRIVPIRELSIKVELPERAQVIVADIRGALPTISGSLRTMIDARERLLAPGGVMMPRRDGLFVAPVDDRHLRLSRVQPWAGGDPEGYARAPLDLRGVERLLVHRWCGTTIHRESLLAPPQRWATIDYYNLSTPHVEGAVEVAIRATGTVHGLAVWFEAEPVEGIRYSTGPGERPTVYRTGFLPLEEPLAVQTGDVLKLRIRCHDSGADYTTRWLTIQDRQGAILASFDQSTFHANILTLKQLKARLPAHVPELKPEAEVARFVLNAASEKRSLAQIASGLRERFPGRFESDAAAVDHAAALIQKLNG